MVWLDVSTLAKLWLTTPSSPNWTPEFDVAPNGAFITFELPIGVHIIELIVNDGIDDSEPDTVLITVVGPTLPVIH